MSWQEKLMWAFISVWGVVTVCGLIASIVACVRQYG